MKIKLRKSELWGKEFSLLIGGDRAWTKHSRSAQLSESSYPYMGFLFYLMASLAFRIPLWPFSSIQFSRSVMSDSLRPNEPQHTRPPCRSPTPRVYPNSCPVSRWCHPTISSSVVPFSSCPQSFPASVSLQMSQLFASGGQSMRVSTSTAVLGCQDWSPLGWTCWISLQSKGLLRVFSNTTVQKHQFFCAQLSL